MFMPNNEEKRNMICYFKFSCSAARAPAVRLALSSDELRLGHVAFYPVVRYFHINECKSEGDLHVYHLHVCDFMFNC